jgi:hypothetical protein
MSGVERDNFRVKMTAEVFTKTELVIEIETSVAVFNSIEWSKSENKIWLHIFHEEEDIQITFDFDDLDILDQYIIFSLLSSITYN